MPKNIIDVPVFTDPIVVPVDADARNAASVEVAFQGLANRTRANRALHLGNFQIPEGSGLTATGTMLSGGAFCYDESSFAFSHFSGNGQGGISQDFAGGIGTHGLVFDDEVGPNPGGAGVNNTHGLAADGNGVRVAITGEADGVRRSASMGDGTWPLQTIPAAPGLNFRHVDHDRNADGGGGLFAIMTDLGVIYTSPDGITWTLRASGLAAAAPINIKHNRDPLFPLWIAYSSTEVSRSADGITWALGGIVNLAGQGITAMRQMQYSPTAVPGEGTWISNAGFIVRSDDQGLTWTEALLLPDTTGTTKGIASDREGNWLAGSSGAQPGVANNLFSSVDNGATWRQEFARGKDITPGDTLPGSHIIFGDGRFLIISSPSNIAVSMRVR